MSFKYVRITQSTVLSSTICTQMLYGIPDRFKRNGNGYSLYKENMGIVAETKEQVTDLVNNSTRGVSLSFHYYQICYVEIIIRVM